MPDRTMTRVMNDRLLHTSVEDVRGAPASRDSYSASQQLVQK